MEGVRADAVAAPADRPAPAHHNPSRGRRANLVHPQRHCLRRPIAPAKLSIRPGPPWLGATLFIRGGRSRYVSAEDKLTGIPALFPNSEVATVPDVGHWLHAEAPEAVAGLVRAFLVGTTEGNG